MTRPTRWAARRHSLPCNCLAAIPQPPCSCSAAALLPHCSCPPVPRLPGTLPAPARRLRCTLRCILRCTLHPAVHSALPCTLPSTCPARLRTGGLPQLGAGGTRRPPHAPATRGRRHRGRGSRRRARRAADRAADRTRCWRGHTGGRARPQGGQEQEEEEEALSRRAWGALREARSRPAGESFPDFYPTAKTPNLRGNARHRERENITRHHHDSRRRDPSAHSGGQPILALVCAPPRPERGPTATPPFTGQSTVIAGNDDDANRQLATAGEHRSRR